MRTTEYEDFVKRIATKADYKNNVLSVQFKKLIGEIVESIASSDQQR